jgi:ribosome-binding ATPase YchF (GTP1/OBG family)
VKLVDTNKKTIYKYGMTKHLSRRMNEHKRKYGDNIESIQWSMVPEQYLSEAEIMIRNTTKPYSYTDKAGEKELISLNNDELKSVISMYDIVGKRYLGCANEIKHYYDDQIKDTKHETEMTKQKMITLETKIESQASQIESQASQIEFLQQLVLKYMNTHGLSE